MSKTTEQFFIRNVRASFLYIFNDKGEYQGTPNKKYSLTLIFDKKKEHKKQLKNIQAMIDDLVKTELKGDEPEDRYYVLKNDDRRTKRGNRLEYKGFYTLKASNESRPVLMDLQANKVSPDDHPFYAGCRVNVKVSLWANDGPNGPVLGCNIIGVQFAGHDDPLTDSVINQEEAMEGFEEIEGEDPF